MSADQVKNPPADPAPDPDEDDLDDLDDVLDEFRAKPTAASAAATTAPGISKSKPPTDQSGSQSDVSDLEADFAKQLQSGMSELIAELDNDPEMQKQFEAMMKELIAAGAAPTNEEAGDHIKTAADVAAQIPSQTASNEKPSTKSSASATAKSDPFGDTIRKTMERMQQSGDAATAATASKAQQSSEEDFLAQMLKELQAGGGDGGEEDFNKMLMGMMTQLTNKEILYEPMKELHEKFPGWLEKNAQKTSAEDLKRYQEQQILVREIVTRFERKQYSDDNEEDREYIVDRMQKMQAAGSPPPDLVGDMSAAQEVIGDLDAGCPTQ